MWWWFSETTAKVEALEKKVAEIEGAVQRILDALEKKKKQKKSVGSV